MKHSFLTILILLFFLSCTPMNLNNPADRENIDYSAPRLIFAGKREKRFVKLIWRANQDNINQFIIYRGTKPENLSEIDRVDGAVDSFIDSTFASSEKHIYYYGVKAVLIAGEISKQSNIKRGYIYKTSIPFKDSELEEAVREAIGNGETFIGDAAQLTYLDAANKKIENLSGIEYLVSLTELRLHNNLIGDISPLAELTKLETLSLNNNTISDLTSLRTLKGLTQLNLANNIITDLDPLRFLTGLTTLNLTHNEISDLDPLLHNEGIGHGDSIELKNNPLTIYAIKKQAGELITKGARIDDQAIRPFTFSDPALETAVREVIEKAEGDIFFRDIAGLTTLSAQGKKIKDLSGLEQLTSLTELYLNQNNISDLTPLTSLKTLKHLDLSDNMITNLQPLMDNQGIGPGDIIRLDNNPLSIDAVKKQIPVLKELGVHIGQIAISFPDPGLEAAVREAIKKPRGDIYIHDVNTLKTLKAVNRNISSLWGLSYLTALTHLDLSGNRITNLSSLPFLPELRTLYLSGNRISNLSGLPYLPTLITLDLQSNQIESLKGLKYLPALIYLCFDYNNITSLNGLPNFPALANLYFDHNDITSLKGLQNHSRLTTLSLNNNRITSLQWLPYMQHLECLSLSDNRITNLDRLIDPAFLDQGDSFYIENNPLSNRAINEQIPTLKKRGVRVYENNY